MIRKVMMAVLLFGAIAGFSSGFSCLRQMRAARYAAFEEHIADVCVGAADRRARRLEGASDRSGAAPGAPAVVPATVIPAAAGNREGQAETP